MAMNPGHETRMKEQKRQSKKSKHRLNGRKFRMERWNRQSIRQKLLNAGGNSQQQTCKSMGADAGRPKPDWSAILSGQGTG
jgi:hypothetical protein